MSATTAISATALIPRVNYVNRVNFTLITDMEINEEGEEDSSDTQILYRGSRFEGDIG